MKKYDIRAKFITTIEFSTIEAKNKKKAIEKAEQLLLTDKHLEESQDYLLTWEVDKLIDY